ncbi:type IV pilus assembly protein PilM [Herbiconiux sp. L3-i23]|uniref:type IV pilus assembly protein PilM n=1 Tax=Herbiconiux sp. L3-i23 TaxID=2905871 RepID=UPI00206831B7|nr:type IV pilus assembly protein PilM [Herbiconiux sp. L3-i23]BDI23912.1 pilus assembly protein PilM [Herbiconiux sp. L3-i23]
MPQRVVGIDIGNTGVRAAEVQDPHKAGGTVIRYGEVALPEGAVRDGDVHEVNNVANALRQLWSEAGFKTKDVVFGVGNHKVLARELSMPKMPLPRIRESLPFQVQDLLPVPVSEALLDFYPISEGEGDAGPVIHGLLIAAVKEPIEQKVAAARLAGLNPVGVDLVPFALSRVLLTGDSAKGSVALIDVGEMTTIVVVARDGVPGFVRIIPAGGSDVTRALADRLDLPIDEAERLKRMVGLVASPKAPEGLSTTAYEAVLEIVFSVTSEMLSGLRNTLAYYSANGGDQIERILLTGGAGRMPGFSDALHELTRIPVAEGTPLAGLSLAKNLREREPESGWGAMTVAVGLASGGAER